MASTTSMALGAVDVAKEKGLIGKMVIFGNDGEKDALDSIEAGELTGTQYTDVFQQGRFAALRARRCSPPAACQRDGVRAAGHAADALHHRHQGNRRSNSTVTTLVSAG